MMMMYSHRQIDVTQHYPGYVSLWYNISVKER